MPHITYPLNASGRAQAEQLVEEVIAQGIDARVDVTWEDAGAGTTCETILFRHKRLDMWCQALTPRDRSIMNTQMLPRARRTEILERMTL